MVVITGAAGFIGSCLISDLNHAQITNILTGLRRSRTWRVNNTIKKLTVQIFQSGLKIMPTS
jgi:nucleoside-diphosphate-sugar epimerase